MLSVLPNPELIILLLLYNKMPELQIHKKNNLKVISVFYRTVFRIRARIFHTVGTFALWYGNHLVNGEAGI